MESSGEGTNHLRSPPVLPWYTLPSLAKIGEKLQEEFMHNQTRSFPYLLDMAVTVKVARTRTERP